MKTQSARSFGILRSVIALFLIPATQLIVSYSIDIGNSMTYEVQKYIEPPTAVEWSKAQTVDQNTVKQDRLIPTSDFAQRSTMSVLQHLGLNAINMLLNYGLLVLITFQLVLACYLLLLGPIAASLFTWPSGIGTLFKPVFKSWLDGLTILVLWRFWWCIHLALHVCSHRLAQRTRSVCSQRAMGSNHIHSFHGHAHLRSVLTV